MGRLAGTWLLVWLGAGCLQTPGGASDDEPDGGVGPIGSTHWQLPLGESVPYLAVAGEDIVLAAGFTGTVELGERVRAVGGGSDLLLAVLTAGGQPVVVEAHGGPADESPTAVAVSPISGEVVVVGTYGGAEANLGGETLPAPGGGSNLFAARYSKLGAHAWSLAGSATGGVEAPSALSMDGSGDVALTGDFGADLRVGEEVLPFDDLGRDLYVARLSSAGSTDALVGYGGMNDQLGAAAIFDGLNKLYLVGTQNGPFVIDDFSPDSDADGDMFVTRLDESAAEATWLFDSVGGRVGGLRAAAMPDGCLLLSGWFEGNFAFDLPEVVELNSRGGSDVFIAVIGPNGDLEWLEQLGGAGDDQPLGVAVGPDGSFAVTGAFRGAASIQEFELTSAGGSDIFVVDFAADRQLRWARWFGDVEDDEGLSVAVDDRGAVVLAARFRGQVDFGLPEPLSTDGGLAAALVRFY